MIYVLTKSYNDYDQHGDYFVAAFKTKPTVDVLIKELKLCTEDVDDWDREVAVKKAEHILNGGGRIDHEYDWYYLISYEFGTFV